MRPSKSRTSMGPGKEHAATVFPHPLRPTKSPMNLSSVESCVALGIEFLVSDKLFHEFFCSLIALCFLRMGTIETEWPRAPQKFPSESELSSAL